MLRYKDTPTTERRAGQLPSFSPFSPFSAACVSADCVEWGNLMQKPSINPLLPPDTQIQKYLSPPLLSNGRRCNDLHVVPLANWMLMAHGLRFQFRFRFGGRKLRGNYPPYGPHSWTWQAGRRHVDPGQEFSASPRGLPCLLPHE